MHFFEACLQGMKFTISGHPFNGRYFAAIGLNSKHSTAFNGFVIYVDGAGAAHAGLATNMRTR
jgi:hypothetical protein